MLYYNKKPVQSKTTRLFRATLIREITLLMDNSMPHKQHLASYCLEAIRHWFSVNTLSPAWLYKGLRHRFVGYAIVLGLQIATVAIMNWLIRIDATFRFSGLLAMLMVVVLALNWGPAPGLITTC